MNASQFSLFESVEPERQIWNQLPEECRQRIVELFAAVLIEHLVCHARGADDEVTRER